MADIANNNSNEPDFEADKGLLLDFINDFTAQSDDGSVAHKYLDALENIHHRTSTVFNLELDDLVNFDAKYEHLAARILHNTFSYHRVLSECVDQTFNVNQRFQAQPLIHERHPETPALARKRYSLYIIPPSKAQKINTFKTLRSVRSSDIGSLITFRGIVVRLSDLRPLLSVATYQCERCSSISCAEVHGISFIPLDKCVSDLCKAAPTRGRLELKPALSKFIKIQEIRIQEVSSEVPVGSVPRTVTVFARGDGVVRKCVAGDEVVVSGIHLPVPQSEEARRSNRERNRLGLGTDTYYEAQFLQPVKNNSLFINEDGISETDHERQLKELVNLAKSGDGLGVYETLANSIAPEIFGHLDVKKALLLQLIGGVRHHLEDGVKLRGDVNILLIGDPGVAKSQLLKKVSNIAQRSIYTTGRGSSGVGLTANVQIDSVTKEATLDGGALVLADLGLCCIDEFDKMDDLDRTSLYETMEQQTVSIAKGGITTTLNARTAVLAAANPCHSRYDPALSPAKNINMAAALLTRFDIVFVLLDTADPDLDRELASHVAMVHCGNAESLRTSPVEVLRGYINMAKEINPVVPPELANDIVARYVSLRSDDDEAVTLGGVGHVSPRSLMTILRLSQAIARVKLSERVTLDDVNEAMRLMQSADRSLNGGQKSKKSVDVFSSIFNILKGLSDSLPNGQSAIPYSQAMNVCQGRGFTNEQLEETLALYEGYNVLRINNDGDVVLV
ncbi:hypothetical protein P9112_013822 [Eukaryota sp. TZLM1-RC]